MPKNDFQQLVRKVSDHYESDIFLYIGIIDRPFDDNFIARVKSFKRRPNIILILTTLGGDPNAAYRMARCLQTQYDTVEQEALGEASASTANGKFRLYVDTRCKSAGTILATGANIIMFSDYGELGPIDVQLRKGDEVGERASGLTPTHALESLQQLALKHFEDCFKELRFNEQLAFTTKTACGVAKEMAVGLYSPIFGQIDPMRIGEFDRALRIATDYGARLGKKNLKEDALSKLLTKYPSHAFVIDKQEAKELFNVVEEPCNELVVLGEATRRWWNEEHLTADVPLILCMTTDAVLDDDPPEPPQPPQPETESTDEEASHGASAGENTINTRVD